MHNIVVHKNKLLLSPVFGDFASVETAVVTPDEVVVVAPDEAFAVSSMVKAVVAEPLVELMLMVWFPADSVER